MPTARPYDDATADLICERIAAGESLNKITKDPSLPSQSLVYEWLAATPKFVEKYTRARESQMEAMAQEIIEIADDSSQDTEEIQISEDVTIKRQNTEWINRSRLRVDTRKWLMSKLAPKKYGDKMEHTGPGGGAIQIVSSIPRPPKDEEGS